MTDHPDRPHEDEQLRRLLDDTVRDIDPRDRLEEIRMRTTVTPLHRRPWVLGAAGAALATAATVAAVAVVGTNAGTPEEGPGFAGSPSASAGATGPVTTGEPSPTATADTQITVPAYFLGDTPRGPRLYREFHRRSVVSEDDRLTAAAAAALGTPRDPDYRSGWPDGVEAGSASLEGDVITVDLSTRGGPESVRERPEGMTEQEASLALDQMIYTLQAAAQEGRPGVQFLVDGGRTDTLLGEPVSEPLAQSDPVDVQALVWITEPGEGAEVSAPFEVSGVANAFEANVQWELMQGRTVVERGFTTAEAAFTFAEYSFEVPEVPAGEYTLVVHDSDPSGGAEGPGGVNEDTKNVTVVP